MQIRFYTELPRPYLKLSGSYKCSRSYKHSRSYKPWFVWRTVIIKHDANRSSQSHGVAKVAGPKPGSKRLCSWLASRQLGGNIPTNDQPHREAPVHVTKQVARMADAERPPSNRRRAAQPPGGNGGDGQQPGDNSGNHQFSNGSGGDGGNGKKGDGDKNDKSIPAVLSTYEKPAQTDEKTMLWYCSYCQLGPWNVRIDSYCHNCQHSRDSSYRTEAWKACRPNPSANNKAYNEWFYGP
ncbi:hypothetical protein F5Y14DRAFT_429214 [Nemania sp. NC0429]|nr:hypothetical protein F5Y14DRAFT_429214 [Nemania sp. NC0429]